MKDSQLTRNDDPISIWLEDLKNGEQAAALKIWNHFVARLCAIARQKIRPETRRVYDEEDAAQSAFQSLCAGIEAGRFPDLNDRRSLWNLLVVITSRKISYRHRHDQTEKRNVNRTLRDSVFLGTDSSQPGIVNTLQSREPSPEFATEFGDTCTLLFNALQDEMLQSICNLRIEGLGDQEIAERMGCSRRTVQRKVELIRRVWLSVEFE